MIPRTSLTVAQIGLAEIDQQHMALVDEFDRLSYWIDKGHDLAAALDALDRLNNYVTKHLDYEEAMLRNKAYPRLAQHIALHSYFRQELANCSRQLIDGEGSAGELLLFLRQWIVEHIGRADVKYAEYLGLRDQPPSRTPADESCRPADHVFLDIDVAITAHKAWRQRLEWAIDGTVSDLPTPERIEDDSACVLGSWLHGAGRQGHEGRSLDELILVHRHFHAHAAQIVRLCAAQHVDEARQLLAADYSASSERVVALLDSLRTDGQP